MRGMLMPLAAATAKKGTSLPNKGGSLFATAFNPRAVTEIEVYFSCGKKTLQVVLFATYPEPHQWQRRKRYPELTLGWKSRHCGWCSWPMRWNSGLPTAKRPLEELFCRTCKVHNFKRVIHSAKEVSSMEYDLWDLPENFCKQTSTVSIIITLQWVDTIWWFFFPLKIWDIIWRWFDPILTIGLYFRAFWKKSSKNANLVWKVKFP